MRVKIILPNFIAVFVLGLVSFLYLKSDMSEVARKQLATSMERMSLLYQRSEAMHGYEILQDVRAHAMSKSVTGVFAPVMRAGGESTRAYEQRLRATLYRKAAEAVAFYSQQWMEKTNKTPDLVFVTDRAGVVIARNITPNACPAGSNVGMLPVMMQVLDSKATYGIWSIDNSPFGASNPNRDVCQLKNAGLLELAAAPIWYGEEMVGTLVVGFELSNGTAKKKSLMLDLGVAFLTGEKVHSSSLGTDLARQSLEEQIGEPGVAKRIRQTIAEAVPSDVFEVTVEGKPHLAMALPMPGAEAKDRVVTLVLGSVDAATSGLGALNGILIMTVLALLAVLIIGFVLTSHFLRPIMAIEEGLLKIINGAYDYRFDVQSDEVGGLSYRINQLVGVLTGEEEENED